ncbi:TPA: hypothetical protein ACLEB8_004810 [Pseudomonas aeruginosa]
MLKRASGCYLRNCIALDQSIAFVLTTVCIRLDLYTEEAAGRERSKAVARLLARGWLAFWKVLSEFSDYWLHHWNNTVRAAEALNFGTALP